MIADDPSIRDGMSFRDHLLWSSVVTKAGDAETTLTVGAGGVVWDATSR